MHFLKTVLVMLFSCTLIGSQAVSAQGGMAAFAADQACACCACEQTGCCVSQAPVTPLEPVASVPAPSQFQTQWVAVLCAVVLHQTAPGHRPLTAAAASSYSFPAVPLFKQNCTFLI